MNERGPLTVRCAQRWLTVGTTVSVLTLAAFGSSAWGTSVLSEYQGIHALLSVLSQVKDAENELLSTGSSQKPDLTKIQFRVNDFLKAQDQLPWFRHAESQNKKLLQQSAHHMAEAFENLATDYLDLIGVYTHSLKQRTEKEIRVNIGSRWDSVRQAAVWAAYSLVAQNVSEEESAQLVVTFSERDRLLALVNGLFPELRGTGGAAQPPLIAGVNAIKNVLEELPPPVQKVETRA